MQHKELFKKVKIVATVGPTSNSLDMLERLIRAGVNIFRINLSHSESEEAIEKIKLIRHAEQKAKKTVSILGDLAGPKIRIGDVPANTIFHTGEDIIICAKPEKNKKFLTVNFPSIIKTLAPGANIYLGDGMIKLTVRRKLNGRVIASVAAGGPVVSRWGFSAEGAGVSRFALSQKDKCDIAATARAGIDALAVSFVQTARDVRNVRRLLWGARCPLLIAKIETASAVKNIEEILDAADGIMVARGDLGLAIPMAELPRIQKKLIQAGLKQAKPVITATQMLESMIKNPLPTRAEVTDVANAIIDGTDAVMLSGETAVGAFPEETVTMMSRIIHASSDMVSGIEFDLRDAVPDALSSSVVRVASQVNARLIIAFTQRGSTPMRIARHRPKQLIVAASPEARTLHTLNFSWGVHTLRTAEIKNIDELLEQAHKIAKNNGVFSLKTGDVFVISAGIPFGKTGTTNLLLVQQAR